VTSDAPALRQRFVLAEILAAPVSLRRDVRDLRARPGAAGESR
jgi:hypothetical protein